MSDSAKIQFTQTKYEEMQTAWRRLSEERKAVMQRLKDAREMGDLSENGAYKYAKLELGSINRQLRELRYLLANGEVFTHSGQTDVVTLGCTVILKTSTTTVTYTLVNKYESEPSQHKLSVESPLGSQLMGKKVGDTIKVVAPAGTTEYHLESIA